MNSLPSKYQPSSTLLDFSDRTSVRSYAKGTRLIPAAVSQQLRLDSSVTTLYISQPTFGLGSNPWGARGIREYCGPPILSCNRFKEKGCIKQEAQLFVSKEMLKQEILKTPDGKGSTEEDMKLYKELSISLHPPLLPG